MLFFVLLLIILAGGIGYAYYRVSQLFDDPAVPEVQDLLPPDAVAPSTILYIWSHPDDETSVSGTIAKYGINSRVRQVGCYFTAGEAGKPGEPPICKPEELALVRCGEMAVAATMGGLDDHEVADYGDGKLQSRDPEELDAQAVRWIREHKPTVIVSWDPSGSSGHPDHIRTHEVVRRAFHAAADPNVCPEQLQDGLEPHQADRLYEYVVPTRLVETFRKHAFRGNYRALDDRLQPTHALRVSGNLKPRWSIFRAHRTQRGSLMPFVAWYGWFLLLCYRKEYFALALEADAA